MWRFLQVVIATDDCNGAVLAATIAAAGLSDRCTLVSFYVLPFSTTPFPHLVHYLNNK